MKLSIMGLYEWDDTILDGITLPDGMDLDALKVDILTECSELEIVYPNPDVFKIALAAWSTIHSPLWERAWNALSLEYNPLWNVDASITDTETRDLAGSEERSYTSESTIEDTYGRTDEGQVAGFNSTTYQNRDKNIAGGSDSRTDEREDSDEISTTDTGTVKHEITRTGNIGVTSSQQLLQAEWEVAKLNLYDTIVQSFKNRFCLQVY